METKNPLNPSMKVSLCLRKLNQHTILSFNWRRIKNKQMRVLFSVKLAQEFGLFYARKIRLPFMKNPAENPLSRL